MERTSWDASFVLKFLDQGLPAVVADVGVAVEAVVDIVVAAAVDTMVAAVEVAVDTAVVAAAAVAATVMAEEEEGVVDLVEGMIGKSKILHTQTLLPIKIAGLV